MRLAAALAATCALAVPGMPAAAEPPPEMAALLLTTADLPAGYQVISADANPYRADLFDLIGTGAPCRLPAEVSYASYIWERSVSVTFLREGETSEDDAAVAEVVADRGPGAAGALVDAAAATMPGRCPHVDIPASDITMRPITMPAIGDRSAAFGVTVGTKSNSASEVMDYFDSWTTLSFAVAAVGSRSVVVVLMGASDTHDVDLAALTRTAVDRARS
ncbi:hypothetical protein [Actinoplanes philippinensis]|uniref:hypothetical protein n=1 Tax=Actinoplanes philippinensis TaxID=35752 RepID=UPI00340100E9